MVKVETLHCCLVTALYVYEARPCLPPGIMITVKYKSQVGNLDLSSLNTPDTPPRAQLPGAGTNIAPHTSCHDLAAAAAAAPDWELCFKETLLINFPGGAVCKARGGRWGLTPGPRQV